MSEDARTAAKNHLGKLIGRILEDGTVDDAERAELQKFFADALLSVSDVKAVFGGYLGALQKEVLADGVVTPEEARKCKAVVDQLRIPLRFLSPELLAIVTGKPS